jgi:hypothetical protein
VEGAVVNRQVGIVLLLVLIPHFGSADTPPAQVSIRGVVTFARERESTTFRLSNVRAESAIRLINERLDARDSVSTQWANVLFRSRTVGLRLFAPDDLEIGHVFDGVNGATAVQCRVYADERNASESSYTLRCIADDSGKAALRDGKMIYEIDIFIVGLRNDSEIEQFLSRAMLPDRNRLLVMLETD